MFEDIAIDVVHPNADIVAVCVWVWQVVVQPWDGEIQRAGIGECFALAIFDLSPVLDDKFSGASLNVVARSADEDVGF